MLASITTSWTIAFPTIFTAFLLLRKLRQAREEALARARVPAIIEQNDVPFAE